MQEGRSAEEGGDGGKTREVGRESGDEGKAAVPHSLKCSHTRISKGGFGCPGRGS